MFGDKFNIGSLLKNMKNIQQMVEQSQNELAKIEVSGESGAGAVKVSMNGRHDILSLDIDDETKNGDKSILQDLIIAAFNDANAKIAKIQQEKMMSATKMFGGASNDDDQA